MRHLVTGIAVALFLLAARGDAGAKDRDLLDALLPGDAAQKRCGLSKLDAGERAALNAEIAKFARGLYERVELGDSAIAYLKAEDDFEVVTYVGARRMRVDPDDEDEEPSEYHIIKTGLFTYICEPQIACLLLPGRYLGKADAIECVLLDRDGDEVEFWTKDER